MRNRSRKKDFYLRIDSISAKLVGLINSLRDRAIMIISKLFSIHEVSIDNE